MATLVLLRHGESAWNATGRFTGWVDVPLTSVGRAQASRSGELLAQAGLLPDEVHTSVLRRAVVTGALALRASGRPQVPTGRTWRLNERCYGALQGERRGLVRARHGERQFALWRRSYDAAPPALEPGSRWDVSADPRYAGLPVPLTESLADVVARLLPYWFEVVAPTLRAGCTVLDEELAPVVRGGRYLDPALAQLAAVEVANQGRPDPPARQQPDQASSTGLLVRPKGELRPTMGR